MQWADRFMPVIWVLMGRNSADCVQGASDSKAFCKMGILAFFGKAYFP